MALVDILEQILDGSNRSADFDIDMTVISKREIPVVGHYVAVVHSDATFDEKFSVVTTSIVGVAVFVHRGRVIECLGVSLGARSVFHASTLGASVNHICGHDLVQFWLHVFVRKLSGNDAIDDFRGCRFACTVKDEEDVCMRKSTFLKFDHIHMCNAL